MCLRTHTPHHTPCKWAIMVARHGNGKSIFGMSSIYLLRTIYRPIRSVQFLDFVSHEICFGKFGDVLESTLQSSMSRDRIALLSLRLVRVSSTNTGHRPHNLVYHGEQLLIISPNPAQFNFQTIPNVMLPVSVSF